MAKESSDVMHDERHSSAAVAPGARVTLHFSLALADGSIVDSNYDGQPATFVVGDGNLLPGFEEALQGRVAGESVSVTLAPDQAFGQHNIDNVQRLPRHRFAALLANTTDPVQPGTVVAFTDAGGNDIPGVLTDIGETDVEFDFNHPLAGRDIYFRADIISVIPAGTDAVRIQG